MWPITYFTEYILKKIACWVILNALLLVLEKLFNFFFKNTLFVFRSGPIQHFVGPDLGPNCLLRLWVDDIFLQSAPHFEQCSNIILNLIALYLVKQYHIKGYRQADIFGHIGQQKRYPFVGIGQTVQTLMRHLTRVSTVCKYRMSTMQAHN